MAIDTSTPEGVRAGARDRGQTGDPAPMAGRLVTLLTQKRRTHLQHGGVDGSMRVVADGAVLGDRLVRAQERTALVHMAGVAGVVDAVADHQVRADRAVGVMAVRAGHLALGNGVVRGAADLGALRLVAVEAHFGLSALIAYRIMTRVHLMARRATNLARGVDATRPVNSRFALVTTEANRALLGHRVLGTGPERHRGGELQGLVRVGRTRAMAGLTLLVCEGRAGVVLDRMPRAQNRYGRGLVVAVEASLGASFSVAWRYFLCRSRSL